MMNKSRVLAPLFAVLAAGFAGVSMAVPSKLCLVDDYGNRFKLTVDSANGFIYGNMDINVSTEPCLSKTWTVLGSYVVHGGKPAMELTVSNPLAAVDSTCAASFMLKGNFPDYAWYYPDGTANLGPTTYNMCSASGTEQPANEAATGRGLRRVP